MFKLALFLTFVVLVLTVTTSPPLQYTLQQQWTGQCNLNGVYQSPIDIPCADFIDSCPASKKYQIYWKSPMVTFGNSTYEDLKTFFTDNSWLRYSNNTNDYTFKSWQFHFHQPSQHTVNGVSYELQVHLVHRRITGAYSEYAVVGIFFEVDDNLEYDIFDSVKINSPTQFQHLFPFAFTNKQAYHYRGSLTTPPCTEAVNWFVQLEPIKIRREHMDELTKEVGGGHPNNRRTQRLGNRTVYVVGQDCP